MPPERQVVVALHAHPDDESLLTGGTIAALARRGHRVVVVVATDGAHGLTGAGAGDLVERRQRELDRAADLLGVARVVRLGYRDSGDDGGDRAGFCHVDVGVVARRVADVVEQEDADLLIGYDEHGGYGHPDHVQVHRVAVAAADLTGVRLLLATVDRAWLERGLRLAGWCRLVPQGTRTEMVGRWFSSRREITHRVRVWRLSRAKRDAIACHASQASGGVSVRTVRLLARLPLPLFALVAGTEWFVEPGERRAGGSDRSSRGRRRCVSGDPLVAAAGSSR